ncbi:uncharacterized protein LOC123651449 [Pipistrellus kuhlii]|uniref:Uncharacterized protein n=1 Tax=Pipistrellus kuhlii TaxID=59472 RepID=A0A7J7RZU7_PIPKU|nr:uncharacterized protein LOC123651449 [Pipistrellus kuhlii]KAF6281670.1 hypothetical protein mPipKuh1_010208 [Pipistrellus kuhlii]
MFVEKGLPFGLPLWDPRERRARPPREAKGRRKACVQGPARVRECFYPELERRASPVREKMWIPFGALVVIGRKMELLGRNKKKRKFEETVWKTRPGLSQERNVRLLHRLVSVLGSSVGLAKRIPREVWGKPEEARRRTKAEVGSAGTRRLTWLKEAPRAPRARISKEDVRSRGYRPGQNEELSISGGKVKLSERGSDPERSSDLAERI